ncbi:sec-independent protein translocase protein TatC [Microbacteriaceae bacterium MWH-Ta3]|nr:sec-independent protein translocase protein TatC [Microbacteriaceae bacterium MWH-Ta3]
MARTRNPEGRMSLGEHLVEFRKRLFSAALAIAAGAIGGFLLSDLVWAAIAEPILAIGERSGRLAEINYTSITEAFDTKIAISLTVGIIITSPVWLYQIWAFIVPALVRKEKVYAVSFFAAAVPLFLAGCAAGWWVFPHVVELMVSFAPAESTTLLTAKYYLDFTIKFILAIGVGFVLPVFLVLLNFVGVLSARAILKGWRWAILSITVFTAMATPAADVLSMFVLAVPMVALYYLAALIAVIHDKRVAKKQAALLGDLA